MAPVAGRVADRHEQRAVLARARGAAPPRPTAASRRGCRGAGAGRATSPGRARWPWPDATRSPRPARAGRIRHVASTRARHRALRPRPPPSGPTRHAVRRGGLLFCSGQIAARPGDRRARRRRARRRRPPAAWRTSTRSAPPPAPRWPTPCADRLLDRPGALRRGQRGLRRVLRRRPAGPRRRSASPRCRSARRSRSTPSSRCPTDAVAIAERPQTVTAEAIARARAAIADVARRTPVLAVATLERARGGDGRAQGREPPAHGLVQGPRRAEQARRARRRLRPRRRGRERRQPRAGRWRYAARVRGVPCEVFMPDGAPIAKVEAAAALGATVRVAGELGRRLPSRRPASAPREAGMAFVHPFDDPDVVAGQGTLGLELLEEVPDLATVIVPVGGGGLASGIAIAVKSARPDVAVVGVQVETVAAYPASLRRGEPVAVAGGADDRRRHRRQAARRRHAAARARLARRRRRRARGRRRRGDGPAHGEGEARRRGRGRGRRRGAPRRPGRRRRRAGRRRRPQRRQRRRRAAGVGRPPPRDRGRPPAGALHARPRPPRLAGAPARARRRGGREPRRRRAPARGRRPPRPRDRRPARPRDARPRARRAGPRARCGRAGYERRASMH